MDYLCRFASHSFRRGHFLFARLSAQSPQMVMSWLQGVKPSCSFAPADFFMFALRALLILLTFGISV